MNTPTLEELIQPGRLRSHRLELRLGLVSVARSIGVTVEELSRAERGGSPDVAMEAARFYAGISVEPEPLDEDEPWTPESRQPAPGLDPMSPNSRVYYLWLLLRYKRDHEGRAGLEAEFREFKRWGGKHYEERTPDQMREEIRQDIEEMLS